MAQFMVTLHNGDYKETWTIPVPAANVSEATSKARKIIKDQYMRGTIIVDIESILNYAPASEAKLRDYFLLDSAAFYRVNEHLADLRANWKTGVQTLRRASNGYTRFAKLDNGFGRLIDRRS